MVINGIKDDRVGAGLVSVTYVDVSKDLQHAKIFVSIYGDESAKSETMAGLTACTGFVRRELAHRIRLRHAPEIRFVQDASLEQGDRLINLINQINHPAEAEEITAEEEQ